MSVTAHFAPPPELCDGEADADGLALALALGLGLELALELVFGDGEPVEPDEVV